MALFPSGAHITEWSMSSSSTGDINNNSINCETHDRNGPVICCQLFKLSTPVSTRPAECARSPPAQSRFFAHSSTQYHLATVYQGCRQSKWALRPRSDLHSICSLRVYNRCILLSDNDGSTELDLCENVTSGWLRLYNFPEVRLLA
jgi:hypothetical protein